jgi:hypothetical protein
LVFRQFETDKGIEDTFLEANVRKAEKMRRLREKDKKLLKDRICLFEKK